MHGRRFFYSHHPGLGRPPSGRFQLHLTRDVPICYSQFTELRILLITAVKNASICYKILIIYLTDILILTLGLQKASHLGDAINHLDTVRAWDLLPFGARHCTRMFMARIFASQPDRVTAMLGCRGAPTRSAHLRPRGFTVVSKGCGNPWLAVCWLLRLPEILPVPRPR